MNRQEAAPVCRLLRKKELNKYIFIIVVIIIIIIIIAIIIIIITTTTNLQELQQQLRTY